MFGCMTQAARLLGRFIGCCCSRSGWNVSHKPAGRILCHSVPQTTHRQMWGLHVARLTTVCVWKQFTVVGRQPDNLSSDIHFPSGREALGEDGSWAWSLPIDWRQIQPELKSLRSCAKHEFSSGIMWENEKNTPSHWMFVHANLI